MGNCGTQVVFRTPDPDEARYLAGVLDNAVAPEDIQMLGLRQCYLQTSDASGPLPVVSAMLPPPPRSDGRTARLIAAACARRYGRPMAEVLAVRARWMATLFYSSHNRGTGADEACAEVGTISGDNQVVSGLESAEPAAAEMVPAGAEDLTPRTEMGLGSQPILGLPPTRASTYDGPQPRRSRRRKHKRAQLRSARGLPFPSAIRAGPDPLPPPVDPAPALQQLPLLPDRDAA